MLREMAVFSTLSPQPHQIMCTLEMMQNRDRQGGVYSPTESIMYFPESLFSLVDGSQASISM